MLCDILLILIFLLLLVILVRGQIIGGKVILKQVKDCELIISQILLISEPTHILKNSSSCVDLIFTDQSNLITDGGTHPSLHPNCHHNITFYKINLKITYTPPCRRLVWDFKRANISSIRKAIKMVDWQFMFLNKNTHEQVAIFNDILMNIFSNYIPNKYVTIDNRDPPWMTEKIKNKINLKRSLSKSNKFIEIQMLSTEISTLILERKEKYYHDLSMKLNDPKTSAKTYWSILKSFYNDSKIPLIPPLLVNNKIVSDFTEKANLFNDFFVHRYLTTANCLQQFLSKLSQDYLLLILKKKIF